MLDPRYVSNIPPLSRVTGAIGLLIAGGFGLAAMWWLPQPVTNQAETPTPKVSVAAGGLAAAGTEAADGSVLVRYAAPDPPKAGAQELERFCVTHVNRQRSFVLFSRGTCVIVNEPCEDQVAEAVQLLGACAESDARFVPERTRDGGMIISFKEPVFHRFSDVELGELTPWLNQVAPTLMTPEEVVSADADWEPPFQARVGLLARRRLLEDAASPVAVRVIKAKVESAAAD